MRPLAAFVLFAASGAAAGAPVPKHLMKVPEDTEQAKFQGKWTLESVLMGGRHVDFDRRAGTTFEFRAGVLTIDSDGRRTGKVRFDTAGAMKRITMTEVRAENKDGTPGWNEDDSEYGYVIRGNTLVLAATIGESGKKAAADPTSLLGSDAITLVLIRWTDKQ